MPGETYQIQASWQADRLRATSQTTGKVRPSLSETHQLLIIVTCQIETLCSHTERACAHTHSDLALTLFVSRFPLYTLFVCFSHHRPLAKTMLLLHILQMRKRKPGRGVAHLTNSRAGIGPRESDFLVHHPVESPGIKGTEAKDWLAFLDSCL